MIEHLNNISVIS